MFLFSNLTIDVVSYALSYTVIRLIDRPDITSRTREIWIMTSCQQSNVTRQLTG